jgi:creatinine amidohydrolase
LVAAAYWDLTGVGVEAVEEMQSWRITHACEFETSMMLFLTPEFAEMSVARGGTARIDSDYYVPDYARPGKITPAYLFEEVTPTGAMGRPDLATSAKGERLLAAIADEIVAFLKDFRRWGTIERGIAE